MDESQALKQHISQLSDEQLITMVTVEAGDYRKQALDFAKAELAARGVNVQEALEKPASDEELSRPLDSHGLACPTCGGVLRSGTLIAEKEITVIFTDNHEERFVQVRACSRCGQISMAVDFETDVRA